MQPLLSMEPAASLEQAEIQQIMIELPEEASDIASVCITLKESKCSAVFGSCGKKLAQQVIIIL